MGTNPRNAGIPLNTNANEAGSAGFLATLLEGYVVTKTCSMCGHSKPFECFYATRGSLYRTTNECRDCVKDRNKPAKLNNKHSYMLTSDGRFPNYDTQTWEE